jgi:hypothetical protein
MADLLATAADWLADQLIEHVSQAVTYTRYTRVGSTVTAASVSVSATIGRSEFEQADGEVLTRFRSVDFLIRPADLVLSGSEITPARGDRIDWNGATYEVMDDSGRPADRDEHGKLWRVHTKQVS